GRTAAGRGDSRTAAEGRVDPTPGRWRLSSSGRRRSALVLKGWLAGDGGAVGQVQGDLVVLGGARPPRAEVVRADAGGHRLRQPAARPLALAAGQWVDSDPIDVFADVTRQHREAVTFRNAARTPVGRPSVVGRQICRVTF